MTHSLLFAQVTLDSKSISDSFTWLLMIVAMILILFGFFLVLARRYKRCPSNRILVIYGKTGAGRSSRCIHGGAAFVYPLIQNYEYLSLDPVQIEIPLQGALSIENIRVNVPSVFTVAIGTDEETMNNAAIRLLGLPTQQIIKQAEDMIFGQLRQVIASMRIDEINRDRDVFLSKIQTSLEPELKKLGLVLINVNIKDITDESGYIEAIGRKAASEAIQQAEIDVAQQVKRGAIGVAEADRDKLIQVANNEKTRDMGTKEAERERAVRLAELEKERQIGEQSAAFEQESRVRSAEQAMRISVADANARAVSGENKSKAEIAAANAELKVREAEAYQLGETRSREAQAAVLEAQYLAQARAAEAQGKKVEAEKRAELESMARAVKAQVIVDAEAEAERRTIEAQGEARAIFAKLEAEARGNYEILAKKGEGLKRIIESCGGAQPAFQMMMLEHIDELSKTAAQAIANIKFDKVVVWDSGAGKDGNNATSNFLKGVAGSLPPMMHMMSEIGGVKMPEYFGKLENDVNSAGETPPPPAPAAGSEPKPKKN
ncbi:MAG: flotillin family protein [Planctomycetes bacterium]|nr:flotillin family protein [Planctomycetota bacterium]